MPSPDTCVLRDVLERRAKETPESCFVTFEDGTYTFRFNQNSFIFCTTEAQKIFHALADRLYRIDMEDYSYIQLGQIIQNNLKSKSQFVEEDIINEIANI